MPVKTPTRIVEKVLKLWLLGYTRDEISEKVGTSVGNIVHIITETKKNLPDITLLREIVVRIRKQGWTQDAFSTAIRHRNILYGRGLTDGQIDDLIELVDEHCFKRGISLGSFLANLEKISLLSEAFECNVEDLDSVIKEKESQVASAQELYYNMVDNCAVTASELEQYKKDKPLLETIKNLREQIEEGKSAVANWQLEAAEFFNRSIAFKAPEGMSTDDVNRAVRLMLDHAPRYRKEIQLILDKELPKE